MNPYVGLPVGACSSANSLNREGALPPSCCSIMKARWRDRGDPCCLIASCNRGTAEGCGLAPGGCWACTGLASNLPLCQHSSSRLSLLVREGSQLA